MFSVPRSIFSVRRKSRMSLRTVNKSAHRSSAILLVRFLLVYKSFTFWNFRVLRDEKELWRFASFGVKRYAKSSSATLCSSSALKALVCLMLHLHVKSIFFLNIWNCTQKNIRITKPEFQRKILHKIPWDTFLSGLTLQGSPWDSSTFGESDAMDRTSVCILCVCVSS